MSDINTSHIQTLPSNLNHTLKIFIKSHKFCYLLIITIFISSTSSSFSFTQSISSPFSFWCMFLAKTKDVSLSLCVLYMKHNIFQICQSLFRILHFIVIMCQWPIQLHTSVYIFLLTINYNMYVCKQNCNFSHFSWNYVSCCTASSTYCLPYFIHLLTFLLLSLKPFNQVMWQSLIEKPQKIQPSYTDPM